MPHEWQWLCMSDIAHQHTHTLSLVHVHTQKLRDRFMKAARKIAEVKKLESKAEYAKP